MKVIRTDAATIDSHIDSDYVYVTHYAPWHTAVRTHTTGLHSLVRRRHKYYSDVNSSTVEPGVCTKTSSTINYSHRRQRTTDCTLLCRLATRTAQSSIGRSSTYYPRRLKLRTATDSDQLEYSQHRNTFNKNNTAGFQLRYSPQKFPDLPGPEPLFFRDVFVTSGRLNLDKNAAAVNIYRWKNWVHNLEKNRTGMSTHNALSLIFRWLPTCSLFLLMLK